MLLGAFLAIAGLPSIKNRILREVIGLIGLGLIAYAIFAFDKDTPFPGLNALFPCVGAWLIIYATSGGGTVVSNTLSFRPLVFVGVISYSLYLWHWPVIVFGKYFAAGYLSNVEIAIAIFASLAFAFLSFEFIESPFRGTDSAIGRRQVFRYGIAASLIALAVGFVIYCSEGFPQRYDGRTLQIISSNIDRRDDYQDLCPNFRKEIHAISDIEFCEIGSNPSKNIMFWGDSHAQQLYPVIQKLYQKKELHNRGVIFAIAAGCPPTEHMNNVKKRYHCDAFSHFAMIRAQEPDIDTVFIGFSTWWSLFNNTICTSEGGQCVETLSKKELMRRFLDEMSKHIHTLRSKGKRVIVSLPFPQYMTSIPDVQIHNAIFGKYLNNIEPVDRTLPEFREQIQSVAKQAGATIYEPRENLCDKDKCTYQINGVSILKDGSHIAASQIGILEPGLLKTLRRAFKDRPEFTFDGQ